MRLTLRTMLAYLDDILEPEDTDDIGKKIEESEFATNLVHRSRDCIRRVRLGVPPVFGRGLAADPNTVAEYLDNTLSGDRVPEFERICLESDVHLAEVASCHQILTLVLGEPAEIDADSRQRMYQLAAHVDAPPLQNDPIQNNVVKAEVVQVDGRKRATPPSAPPPVQRAPRRAKPEVPEYLREPQSRFWPVAAAVIVAALLTCGGLIVLGPAQWREQVATLVQAPGENPDPTTPDAQALADKPAGDAEESDARTTDTAEAAASQQPSPLGTADKVPDDEAPTETTPNIAASAEDADAPLAPGPDDEPEATNPKKPGLAAVAGDAVADEAAADLVGAPTGKLPVPGKATARPLPPDAAPEANPIEPLAADETDAAGLPPGDMPEKPNAENPRPDDPVADRPEEESFGRYASQRGEVLLKFDPNSGSWKRLAAKSPLAKGDRLLSLPLFRPTITLSNNITLSADGAALLELVGWTDQGVPIVSIEFGRFLMDTVGKAGNQLQLKLDDHQPLVTFVDSGSTLAIDVRRVLPPGKDPSSAAPLSAQVYATEGLIRIREGEAAPVELQAPSQRAILGEAIPELPDGEFPKWVTSESISDAERQATTKLEPQLLPDRPSSLILKELATSRLREVRSLAIRSGCYLGSFDACIAALNEKDEKALWPIYIEELRSAVARNPDTAGQVRSALEKQRAADAPALFRMLWGYTTDDLKNGADRDLVDALNHDSPDMRVLSFWNLQNITGPATLGYDPRDTAAKRKTAVNAWKDKLKKGKIMPRSLATSSTSKSSATKNREK